MKTAKETPNTMTRNAPPPSLLRICFWLLIAMGIVFCIALFTNHDLLASVSPRIVAQVVPGLPTAPSLEDLNLPFVDAVADSQSSASSIDPETYTGIVDFLRMFTPETDPGISTPVVEEEASTSSMSSAVPEPVVDMSQCCRIGDACNEIGQLYSAEECASDKGRIELCSVYCKPIGSGNPAPVVVDHPAAVDESSSSSSFEFSSDSFAIPSMEICGDGVDEDGDFLSDELDPDCTSALRLLDDGTPRVNVDALMPPDDTQGVPVQDDYFQEDQTASAEGVVPVGDVDPSEVAPPDYPIQDLVIEPIPPGGPMEFTPEEIAAQQLQEQHDSWWNTMLKFLGL